MTQPNPTPSTPTPLIAVEELYLSPEILVGASSTDPALYIIPAPTLTKLRTLGIQRTRDMRATSTTLQIVSHLPIDASTKQCQALNDKLQSSIVTNKDRFKALALLPSWDAKEAAAELQRCVTKHRFVGGVIGVRKGGWGGSAWEGAMFGGEKDKEWDEVWRVAELYRVPLAIRVLWPTRDQVCLFLFLLAGKYGVGNVLTR
jgi:predicted TIM-barrel fold metal-dependent hydrolase